MLEALLKGGADPNLATWDGLTPLMVAVRKGSPEGVRALAEAGGIMVIKSLPGADTMGKIFLFTGMEKVRFRRPVFPGDQLHLHVTYERHKMMMWKTSGKAMVDGKIAAEGILTASVVEREDL